MYNQTTIIMSNHMEYTFRFLNGLLSPLTMKPNVIKGIYLLTKQKMCGVPQERQEIELATKVDDNEAMEKMRRQSTISLSKFLL